MERARAEDPQGAREVRNGDRSGCEETRPYCGCGAAEGHALWNLFPGGEALRSAEKEVTASGFRSPGARPSGGVRLVFLPRRSLFPATGYIRIAPLAATLALCACDVQVQDTTPSSYTADGIGIYAVSARVHAGSLVTPGSVVLFAVGEGVKVPLTPDHGFSEYRGLYPVRCRDSFPLQLLAAWRLQGLRSAHKLLPAVQPRQIKLLEPAQPREARFDSSGRPPKGGWQGSVAFRFITVPLARITAAHVEPASGAAADVAAARAIAITSPLPLDADCGALVGLRLATSDPHAHGTLVIDTDDPGVPRWQTRVEFVPQ